MSLRRLHRSCFGINAFSLFLQNVPFVVGKVLYEMYFNTILIGLTAERSTNCIMMKNKMKVALFLANDDDRFRECLCASTASTSVPQTKAASTAKPEKTSVSYDDRIKELSNKLKAGQMVAYYVADQEYNRLDDIYFTSIGFVHTKYADYVAKAKALNAPTLTKPADLPKSYSFQNAILYLKSPERTSSLYAEIEQELKRRRQTARNSYIPTS